MAVQKYSVLIKVLCSSCVAAKDSGTLGPMNCPYCEFPRYSTVTRLKKFFNDVVEVKFPNWVWMRVYKKDTDTLLHTYKNWHNIYIVGPNGEKIPSGRTRDVPDRDQL